MAPIQRLIEAVDMQPVEILANPHGDLPYVTHKGILNLGGLELPVMRLSDGRAVITEEGMNLFIQWLEG